jgi:hypothetical protein
MVFKYCFGGVSYLVLSVAGKILENESQNL